MAFSFPGKERETLPLSLIINDWRESIAEKLKGFAERDFNASRKISFCKLLGVFKNFFLDHKDNQKKQQNQVSQKDSWRKIINFKPIDKTGLWPKMTAELKGK